MHTRTHVLDLVEASARTHPHTIAVTDGSASLTYGRLVDLSRRVGTSLLARNDGMHAVVVAMEKSCDALCALMGALYAGVPYVPVDFSVPVERLKL